jgi:hypothetical protein
MTTRILLSKDLVSIARVKKQDQEPTGSRQHLDQSSQSDEVEEVAEDTQAAQDDDARNLPPTWQMEAFSTDSLQHS